MIDIYLPKHGKTFSLHRDVLRSRCHLIEQAFTCDDGDGECIMFSLPCGTPESFAVIIKWIYTNATHYVKDESDVLLYIKTTNLALALGIWDVLDPLCDRVAEFYDHNPLDNQVINAIETLPDDCKLHDTLIGLTAAAICECIRQPNTRPLGDFESFVLKGGIPLLNLVKNLADCLVHEENRNNANLSESENGENSPKAIEDGLYSANRSLHHIGHDLEKDFQVTLLGPTFHVIASNFAPGTTAADIEAAIASDTTDADGRSVLLSCYITVTRPTVAAELVFRDYNVADRVVRGYNNQRADGRLLRLVHKTSSAPLRKQPQQSDDHHVPSRKQNRTRKMEKEKAGSGKISTDDSGRRREVTNQKHHKTASVQPVENHPAAECGVSNGGESVWADKSGWEDIHARSHQSAQW